LIDHLAPFWLPGGQLQTLWPALYSQTAAITRPAPTFRRERWTTPDSDFIDVDFLQAEPDAQSAIKKPRPLLVLFHGLEGSSASHSSQAFAHWADEKQLDLAIPHFRGCSGELNRAPRAYHSGDHQEIDWILKRLAQRQVGQAVVAVGVSLGGNALMRWAGEQGSAAAQTVKAVASICAPLDLAASGQAMGMGFNRQVYARMFLRSMKPKAMAKWQQFPGLFDVQRLNAATNLFEFDNVFTAPLHGFADTHDYWAQASALLHLPEIQIPALALNARNDPFIPAHSLPTSDQVGRHVTLWQPAHGGHVGFASGPPPGHLADMPRAVGGWLMEQMQHG
jgi:predicted alpha/beta-fold hydrolase